MASTWVHRQPRSCNSDNTFSTMSSTTLTAIAVFENPRRVDSKGKMLMFDAQIYLDAGRSPIVAILRYFNINDQPFEDVGMYSIITTIAKMEKGINTVGGSVSQRDGATSKLNELDYDLIGDIIQLIPISSGAVDPRHLAYVHVSGTVSSLNEADNTFDLDAQQYISAMKDLRVKGQTGDKAVAASVPLGVLPIRCFFNMNSPRYKGRKPPMPRNGAMVSLEGFIFEVTKRDGELPERFCVTLETVNFMGRSAIPPCPMESPGRNTQTPGKRSLKFSFNDLDSPVQQGKRVKPNAVEAQT